MDVAGKIRGAIFDLDGTLLDSLPVWETLAEDYLRSLGLEPRENLNEIFRDFTLEESAAYYREHCGVTLPEEEIIDGINRMVRTEYEESIPAREGAEAFLAALRDRGIRMCVVTLTDRSLACAALRRLGLLTYFEEVFSCAGKGKADPEAFRTAARRLGTKPAETVVFEDSLYAIRTAKEGGFRTCGIVDAGQKDREDILRTADCRLDGFSDGEGFRRLFCP